MSGSALAADQLGRRWGAASGVSGTTPTHASPATAAATMSRNKTSPATNRASPGSGVGAIAATIATTTATIAAHHHGLLMRAETIPSTTGRTTAAKSKPSSATFTKSIARANRSTHTELPSMLSHLRWRA